MKESKYHIDLMSTGYEQAGRVRQKRRTLEALVTAARQLVAEGATPTVDVAAERAGVSRTTAYRYFPSQAALLAAAHPEIVTTTLLPASAPADVAERVEIVVARVTELVVETEPQQRTMLRLSLEPGAGRRELLLRQGRVIGWLADALAPLDNDLGHEGIHRLAVAIRSAIGIESFVWLTDVAGLSPADAVATMRWTACSLLDAARRGSLPPVRSHNDGSTTSSKRRPRTGAP
jgi:AcrR family transcriptional regulator